MRYMRIGAAVGVVAGMMFGASADLVSADLNAPGDGLITQDLDNGLDWLDWTQGLDLSYVAMLTEFGAGGQFEGWRYATEAELDAFMASAGVPDPGGRTVANIPSVTNILSLLGANDFFDFLGLGNSTGAFVFDADIPIGTTSRSAIFTIETFDNPVRAKAGEIGSGLNDLAFGLGHALVRTTPAVSCPCNWNDDNALNSDDFFAFLDDFFAGNADFDGNTTTNSDDFFGFLDCFFNPPAGC